MFLEYLCHKYSSFAHNKIIISIRTTVYSFCILTMIFVFTWLYWLMNKNHKFEFETNRKPMLLFFWQMMFLLIMTLVYNLAVHDEDTPMLNKVNYRETKEFCEGSQYSYILEFLIYLPGNKFKLMVITVSYLFIVQKSS